MAQTKKEKGIDQMLDEALVKENEWPYRIPDNWVWSYLLSGFAECLDKYRKPVNATERAKRKGNIPYYGATGQVGWIDDYLTNEELVLVGEDGAPFLDPFKKKSYMIFGKAWVNNHAHILRTLYGTTGNHFLLHYLNSFDYNGYVSGTTRLKLTQKSLREIPLPLPPFEEQKRIVKKLSSILAKLKEAKEVVQEAKDSFENRRAAILNKAFSGELTRKWREENSDKASFNIEFQKTEKEPYELPQTWKWVKLKNIGTLERGKSKHRPRNDPKLFWGKYPFIQTGDIARADIEIIEHSQTLSEFGLAQSKMFPKGTVCITIAANIADTAILTYASCFPDSVVGFTPNSKFCLSKYLNYYMETIKSDLEEYAPATAQKNINLKILREVLVPIQPLDEQDKIVRIIDRILKNEKEVQSLINLENQIDLIEKSILSKAFRGGLNTNDSNDEPAIKLLEKALQSKKLTLVKPTTRKLRTKIATETKTSDISISKIKLSENAQRLLKVIKQYFGENRFNVEKLKDKSELYYEDFKKALFELLESKLTMEFDKDMELMTYQLKKNEN